MLNEAPFMQRKEGKSEACAHGKKELQNSPNFIIRQKSKNLFLVSIFTAPT